MFVGNTLVGISSLSRNNCSVSVVNYESLRLGIKDYSGF